MSGSILFLCTANACRSQLAEALARALLPPGIDVLSAGTHPTSIDPRAIQVLAELGTSTAGQRSKSIDEISLEAIDRVITLCGEAAELCPAWPGKQREHWPVPDPAQADGAPDGGLAAVRAVRDAILHRVSKLAGSIRSDPAIGVLGGSGFYDLPGLTDLRSLSVDTPFGAPSGPLKEGRLKGKRVVFLARHGEGHRLLPGEVNARANLYALKRMGVTKLISVSAVGSLREEIAPGQVIVPRQLIDRTVGRPATFFGGGVVAHVSLADPVCDGLADALARSCEAIDAPVHAAGTYLCIEGPQFSTRAESSLWRSWGADVIGMTSLPEARLAREAELCYATLALATDYDCWRSRAEKVRVADILSILRANVEQARRIVAEAVDLLDPAAPCGCQRAHDTALLTAPSAIDAGGLMRLHALLQRRLQGEAPRQVQGHA